jgi:hypothetical protein
MRLAALRSIENAYWTAIAAALDAASSPGQAWLCSGPVPARGVALSGSNHIICQFTLQKPCGSVASGALTLNPVNYAPVLNDSEHTFGRFVDGDGNFVFDVDTGVVGQTLPDGTTAAWMWNMASYGIGGLLVPTNLILRFPP